jgi:hypothetical protein
MSDDSNLMPKEFFFTKIDLTTDKKAYVFIDFFDHLIDKKFDFSVGSTTLVVIDSIKSKPRIYKQDLNSLSCFNLSIEWNKAYFQKV